MPKAETLIIGAGPAGLAIAGRLASRSLPFEILEHAGTIANSWHNHYDRLHLHTVRKYSSLPLRPIPASYPKYISRDQLIAYCQDYTEHFSINPHFHQSATSVKKSDGGWIVQTNDDAWESRAVVVATGINNRPLLPGWTNEERFSGSVIHSRTYKNSKPFVDRKVLVVGMGNTGAEVALDLCENSIDVTISLRGPVNIVPRDAFGRPSQTTGMLLDRLPNAIQDAVTKAAQRITVGNLTQYGIETPKLSPSEQLRTLGKSPVLDLGTVARIKSGDIKIRGEISSLSGEGVVFADGTVEWFDSIICCTGYRPALENLIPGIASYCDEAGSPRSIIGRDDLEGLYFLGFDNYRAQGILANINTDSKTIAEAIAGR